MTFNPEDISQDQLQQYRNAAEAAWGDDTRHPDYVGHPQPSAGQCYVTSKWLTSKLDGHVGVKGGHYFWVSPDKNYGIDLTGDQFAYGPNDLRWNGIQLDQEDEPWQMDPHQTRWRPGPTLFKRTSHPLFKDFRVLPSDPLPYEQQQENEAGRRAKLFAMRADRALAGHIDKRADAGGAGGAMGDAYPGEAPQAIEDFNNRYLHDEPWVSDLPPERHEYRWFYGNGQLHVSPIHSHDELRQHAGVPEDHAGPIATGFVSVDNGRATWSAESNIALRGLTRVLKDYGKQVGWKWDGLTDGTGNPVHDDFGPKKAMWYRPTMIHQALNRETEGQLEMAWSPLQGGKRIDIEGRTAYVNERVPWIQEVLHDWARDSGYRLAEYPGGTNMVDRMKNKEWLQQFDNQDPDWEPDAANADNPEQRVFTCHHCGRNFPDFDAFMLHSREHEPLDAAPIEDGHFPQVNDMDDVLPLRHRTVSPTPAISRVVVMPLATFRQASRVPGFDLYSSLWRFNRDDSDLIHYGAYTNGELLGYATMRPKGHGKATLIMIQSAIEGRGIGSALINALKQEYSELTTGVVSDEGRRLIARHGFVNYAGLEWKWAQGSEAKDMIQAPVPFIYDIDHDNITVGHPGGKTSDIMGQFTPGGIVEGYYEPGGNIVVTTETNMPWTARHLMDLWYWSYPHMEITGLEQDSRGQRNKLAKIAGQSVGAYIKTLTATDPAAWRAYQALRKAGGQVYVVGGAVRDALLQKEPKDIDLMVAGIPIEEVSHILSQIPGAQLVDGKGTGLAGPEDHPVENLPLTGKRFGVFRLRSHGSEVEIALPRSDVYEPDAEGRSRRGQGKIIIDHNLPVEKDLLRRDFTANSMAVDLDSGKLVDPYGGAQDIQSGVLRTTHPSSFEEDPTRLVRALVASSRHGLAPDERTRNEMATNAHRLAGESGDTLNKELTKLFKSDHPAGAIRLAQDTGVLKHLFPEVANNFDYDQNNPHHSYPLGDHLLQVLENVSNNTSDPDLRLAGLLHDIGKPASAWTNPDTGYSHYYPSFIDGQPVGADHAVVGADMASARLDALRYPRARIRRVTDLIQHHMFPAFSSPKGARKFLHAVGDHADDLLTLREADQLGKGQTPEELAARTSADQMRGLVEQVRSAQEPTSQSGLSVNGNDLIALGLQPGPDMGKILRQLTNDVVENPALNDRNALMQRAQGYIDALPAGA